MKGKNETSELTPELLGFRLHQLLEGSIVPERLEVHVAEDIDAVRGSLGKGFTQQGDGLLALAEDGGDAGPPVGIPAEEKRPLDGPEPFRDP